MPVSINGTMPEARPRRDVPKARQRREAGAAWDTPPTALKRQDDTDDRGQSARYRVALPWEEFAESWSEAENRLACLEHDLARHELRPFWICRFDFTESAALASLRGSRIAMEDLVLADAGATPRKQSAGWFVARALLSLRRHISRAGPAEILTVDGILEMETRLSSALTAAGTVASETAAPEARRQRIERWLGVVEELRTTPPLPAAAIALRVWRRMAPLASYNDEIGLLLTSTLLWHWGKTKGLSACPATGLQAAGLAARSHDLDDRATLGSWITQFCQAIGAAAIIGQESLQQMAQGRSRAARLMKGRRPNSRLPRVVSLFLTYPVMTARFINQRLDLTAQGADWLLKELIEENVIVETTDRAKNRAYRLV